MKRAHHGELPDVERAAQDPRQRGKASDRLALTDQFIKSGLPLEEFAARLQAENHPLKSSWESLPLWKHVLERRGHKVEALLPDNLRIEAATLRLEAVRVFDREGPWFVPKLTRKQRVEQLRAQGFPLKVSVKLLEAWLAAYVAGGRKLSALLDGVRGGKGKPRFSPDIQKLALEAHERLSAHNADVKDSVLRAALVARVGAARAREIPSAPTLGRFVAQHAHPARRAYMFKGATGYDAVASLKLPSDFGHHRDVLIIDHKQSDIRVWYGEKPVRPWLTTAIDPVSGACRAIVVSPYEPGSAEIALAIRMAILDKPEDPEQLLSGLVRVVFMDMGLDMRSAHVEAALLELGVERVLARAHCPWKRGSIEGNLHKCISLFEERGIPGFVGHKTEERPADVEPVLQFEEYAALIRRYALVEFNRTVYQKKRQLPDGRWVKGSRLDFARAWAAPLRMPDTDTLLFALMKRETRRVQDTGISIAPFTYVSESKEFLELVARRAEVEVRWDPADMSKVYVFDQGRFLCLASDPRAAAANATERTKRLYHKLNAQERKRVRAEMDPLREAARDGTFLEVIAEQAEEQDAVAAAAGGARGAKVIRQMLPLDHAVRRAVHPSPNSSAPARPRPPKKPVGAEWDLWSKSLPEEIFK